MPILKSKKVTCGRPKKAVQDKVRPLGVYGQVEDKALLKKLSDDYAFNQSELVRNLLYLLRDNPDLAAKMT